MEGRRLRFVLTLTYVVMWMQFAEPTEFFPTKILLQNKELSLTYLGPGVCKFDISMDEQELSSPDQILSFDVGGVCSIKITNIFIKGSVYFKDQVIMEDGGYDDLCMRPLGPNFTCPIQAWRPFHGLLKNTVKKFMKAGGYVVLKAFLATLPGPVNVTMHAYTYVKGMKVPVGSITALFNLHRIVNGG